MENVFYERVDSDRIASLGVDRGLSFNFFSVIM